ncbi:SMC family ATPase [Candidatus Woesearchaeota archaeon]|nr:SMC family ATPase [Candidatus Woesearchaeota archaeon]
MLLRRLKLYHIRSYTDTIIDFPAGSLLLSGDIGSGKSTLLLAIEFALFGLSKPDLPGEALLRKGSINGSVELEFTLSSGTETQEISIKRNLKKAQDSIKQTNGYIIINEVKKELTPVELKAEIISLLGYPEEYVSKNKNYIYHYTLYTPQEEMKLILQEEPETRLDVLRKVFNLDKYKNIRENLQNYLRQMRSTLAVMEAKIEPLEEQQRKLEELKTEKVRVEKNLQENLPRQQQVRLRLAVQASELEQLERKQKMLVELQQNYKTIKVMLDTKKEQLQQLNSQQEGLLKQLQELSFPEETNLIQVQQELKQLEAQKTSYVREISSVQERIAQLQKSIQEQHTQVKKLEGEIVVIEEKEKLIAQLEEEVTEKERLKEDKTKIEHKLDEINSSLSRLKHILFQSQELQKKILSLEVCPMCLQPVKEEHKHTISTDEQHKIELAQKESEVKEAEKGEFTLKKEELLNQIEIILKKENLLSRTKIELRHLIESRNNLMQFQQQLNQKVQESNLLKTTLESLTTGDQIESIDQKIMELRELLQKLSQREYLLKQRSSLNQHSALLSEQISELTEKKNNLFQELSLQQDGSAQIVEQKKNIMESISEEREISIIIAQHKTSIHSITGQEEPLQRSITALIEEKSKLVRNKELSFWLEEQLIPLTVTIEKQLMLSIHHLFNQLFQEWFSMLIDDENIASRLDDSFTPIVEQNGYEISFANLSGGEKTSAALAYRLALNKVINDVIHEIKTKDLLILDEPTDGFSSEQLDKVREVLDRLGLGQVIIVSHETKIETFVENVIRVRKEGNVSEVG